MRGPLRELGRELWRRWLPKQQRREQYGDKGGCLRHRCQVVVVEPMRGTSGSGYSFGALPDQLVVYSEDRHGPAPTSSPSPLLQSNPTNPTTTAAHRDAQLVVLDDLGGRSIARGQRWYPTSGVGRYTEVRVIKRQLRTGLPAIEN
jgi:hypothetical protein